MSDRPAVCHVAPALADLLVPIASLKLDKANAKKHPARNIESIAESYRRFGQQKPIIYGPDRVVVAGNGQLAAAQKLGWTHIAAVATNLTGPALRAFALADNRTAELAEWDDDALAKALAAIQNEDPTLALATAFSEAEIAKLMTEDPALPPGIDDLPPQPEPRTRPGDLWTLGEHRLLCGSCTNLDDVKRLADGRLADYMFTSPPYNVGLDYEKDQSHDDLLRLIRDFIAAADTVLGPDAYATVNYGDSATSTQGELTPISRHYEDAFTATKWRLRGDRVWLKPFGRMRGLNVATSTTMNVFDWEFVRTWARHHLPDAKPPAHLHAAATKALQALAGRIAEKEGIEGPDLAEFVTLASFLTATSALDLLPNDWSYARTWRKGTGKEKLRWHGMTARGVWRDVGLGAQVPDHAQFDETTSKEIHPAAFPVVFPVIGIRCYTDRGATVYDPFCGSGTTLVACEKLDRRCLTAEILPPYCDLTVARWETLTGQKAIREEAP